ncbi:putative late blight resistance protein homolog R1B-14 [Ipomoea triloba]|uniref:putative late blight resistance protein homolog R1B-14 n=1 Tax=Ipomoea triloba TaxID=35885 RepID=UPI00125DD564|nr:putative late blight resistance protein homolog R1B-14 [Ipomoea triloba]
MADAAISLLVNRLAQVVEENATLILGIRDHVEELVSDLNSFQAILKQASKHESSNDNDVLRDVVDKIRSVVNEAEDAIDKYLVDTRKHKSKGTVMRYLDKVAYYSKASDAAKQIDAIKGRVAKIRKDHDSGLRELQRDPNEAQLFLQRKAPVVEEDDVVGFDEEAKTIKDRLLDKTNEMMVISIVGMAGLGKTTLTKMVFNDTQLQYEFFTRIWVYVSKTFSRRQIFLDILSNFTKKTKDYHDLSDELLANKVKEFLEGGKYFIVVDDVWSQQDWDHLKSAFPRNMKGSRVLLTTRHENVASHADSSSNPHHLKFLTNDESWELLKTKVFRKETCPHEVNECGRLIAIKCKGLPLAVVVIAGVLNKNSTSVEWKQVADNPFAEINREKQSYHELVKWSYDHLPFYTKDCFLYLAAFPTGHNIDSWKLMRLWIAEGFIPPTEGGYTLDLERTAEKYLKDLIDRNLLMVLNRRADGQIKTCRIHDTLHEFCKFEAGKKNLFHSTDGNRLETNNSNYRRLCVHHSHIMKFLASDKKPSGENIRSFLSSSSKEVEVSNEFWTTIPKAFPTLRVLDIEYLKFQVLSKEFYHLYYLRYLAISTDLKILPKQFNNLWNMQTLVFKTSQNTIEVKADIWSLTKLRHVLINASAQLPPPSKSTKPSSLAMDLQTLSTISPSSCTEEIFARIPNLQKLGIRGNLSELLESRGGSCLFDNIRSLDHLENLKLLHDAAIGQASKLRSIPRAEKFPRKLRKLTLSSTSFEWKDMYILGSLEELEILKLEENAFRGEFLDLSNVSFKHLQLLRMGRTDLVSWTASKNSFPVLKYLHLRHCANLDAVPPAFAEIESLRVVELFCTNSRAAISARDIFKQKQEKENTDRSGTFVFSIYPPDQ